MSCKSLNFQLISFIFFLINKNGFLAQCAMLLDPFSTFDLNVLQCLSEGFLWTGFKPFSFDVIFPPNENNFEHGGINF